MKNTMKLKAIQRIAGIIAFVAIIVFTMSACSGRNEGSKGVSAEQKAADNLFAALESGDANALQSLLSDGGSGMLAMLSSRSSPGGDYTYNLKNFESGQGIIITRYTGKGGVVIVPAQIEGYPVKELGRIAFAKSFRDSGDRWVEGNDNTITAVILPDTIEYIGSNTFRERSDMHTINLPANLIEIGGADYYDRGSTFRGCTELYNLIIPENLERIKFTTTISSNIFRGCGKLPLATRHILERTYFGGFGRM